MRKSLSLLIAGLTLFAIGCSGGEEKAPEASGTSPGGDMNAMKRDDPTAPAGGGFATVQASLNNFCLPCHSAENKKDDVDVTALKSAEDVKKVSKNLLEVLESKKMPPANAGKQPTDEERAALVAAIKGL